MSTAGVGGATSGQAANSSPNDVLRDVDLSEFLKLMITELQNQDPLSPMENHQILQQISQIREIEATDRLGTTMESILLGQSVSSASTLIGKQINGLSDSGNEVSGVVERVSLYGKQATLHVAGEKVSLTNVRDIVPVTPDSAGEQPDIAEILQGLIGQGANE